MGKCGICGLPCDPPPTNLAYDRETEGCSKCRLAETMLRVSTPCVRIEGKTPKECGIEEDAWIEKVFQTRKLTTDRLLVDSKKLKRQD